MRCTGVNFTAYAVLYNRRQLSLILVNKDVVHNAAVSVITKKSFSRVNIMRLLGQWLDSRNATTLGGCEVTASREWTPRVIQSLPVTGGECEVRVPAVSAAIVNFGGLK